MKRPFYFSISSYLAADFIPLCANISQRLLLTFLIIYSLKSIRNMCHLCLPVVCCEGNVEVVEFLLVFVNVFGEPSPVTVPVVVVGVSVEPGQTEPKGLLLLNVGIVSAVTLVETKTIEAGKWE